MKYIHFLSAVAGVGLSLNTALAESHENCGNSGSCTFYGVDQNVWKCMRKNSEDKHNTNYSSAYPSPGFSTTHHTGEHVLKYSFNTNENSVTYEWRVGGVAMGTYWSNIYHARNACAG